MNTEEGQAGRQAGRQAMRIRVEEQE